ncbi:hypothetical protein [Vibrio ostreicida]|uniref:cyanobactin maturation protease PatG family protein n=1 Tax=Vibrio ostreicida TaxID=526588 RepID=UPI00097025D8|nr:hypothetical protein [Vibrio ostreicida]
MSEHTTTNDNALNNPEPSTRDTDATWLVDKNRQTDAIVPLSEQDERCQQSSGSMAHKLGEDERVQVAQCATKPTEEIIDCADQELHQEQNVAQLTLNAPITDYIYAVGVLKPEFPNQGLQEAFYNAAQTLNASEYDYYGVLDHTDSTGTRPYFYIAEQARWVLSIHDVDTYVLLPRSKAELVSFIKALKSPDNSLLSVLSTVVGVVDNSSVSDGTNQNSALTHVVCNHLFCQTLEQLHDSLKKETGVTTGVIQDVLKGLEYQPNDGRSDFSRAKNYLAYRYPTLYLTTHTLSKELSSNEAGYFLDDVSATYTDLASPHTIVDLVFTYKNKGRNYNAQPEVHYHCSVDVTHQFPFVNASLQKFMPLTVMAS